MIYIKEKKRENKNVFEIQTYNDKNKLIYTEELNFETALKKHENGMTYLLLYDNDMIPVSDIFNFLNIYLSTSALNSRIKALNALRLALIFEKIINKKLKDFDEGDINYLKNFLRGISPAGQVLNFELQTKRSNETINGYLSIYRKYLTFLNYKNSYLLKEGHTYTMVSSMDSDTDYKVYSYSSSEMVSKENQRVPMYISVSEFRNIINEVRTNYTLCEECIIRLMFESGLRIGEVLGLTGDDIVSEVINNKKNFIVYIRNRFSDRKDQNAKRCMNITNRKQYETEEYNTYNYGYQLVNISENLFNKINKYIEEVHSYASENLKDNYTKFTIADKVKRVSKYENDNYYVFLNTIGKPLSYQTWNNKLRNIFTSVGIPVDKGSRKNNLNHRFRHGFAMFQIKFMKMNELQLQMALRHKNVKSVSVYFRPTLSDEIEIKTNYIKELYNVIPELDLS